MPELIGKLGYDGRGFSAGMNQALGEAKHTSEKMSGYFSRAFSGGGGVGLVGGIAGALGLEKAVHWAETLSDKVTDAFKEAKIAASQMNLDIETAQRIQKVTTATGTGPETMAMFFEKLAENLEKVRKGEKGFEKLVEAFRELGVSIDDIQKKTRDPIGFQILSGFQGKQVISDSEIAAMREIGGRGGPSLIPAGQVGFDSRIAHAGVISNQEGAALKDMNTIGMSLDATQQEVEKNLGIKFKALKDTWRIFLLSFADPNFFTDLAEDLRRNAAAGKANQKLLAQKKVKDDAAAQQFIDDQLLANQHRADLQTASELDKDTARLRAESNKAAEANDLRNMSPAARRDFLQERASLAASAEAEYKRQADEAMYEGGREKDEAYFRNLQEKNRRVGIETEGELLKDKPLRIHETFDSLARIGGFSQGSAPGQDLQDRIVTATERTAANTNVLTQSY